MKEIILKKGIYYDSVKLMLVTNSLNEIIGVKNAVVVMATDLNKDLLFKSGFTLDENLKVTQNDLVIGLELENFVEIDEILKELDSLLNKNSSKSNSEISNYKSIETAFKEKKSNISIISIPGEYAFFEAKKSLDLGMNVMLFSDNISLEQELELKEYALSKKLLVMGPDCGTAHINGVPLCFSNNVEKGNISIIGASGTGSQELMCLIDKMGSGINQVIGTGGRDLSEKIGGITTIMALDMFQKDKNTEIISLISKPPSKKVKEKVVDYIRKNITKKVIVHFIGESENIVDNNIYYTDSIKELAVLSSKLSGKYREIKKFDLKLDKLDKGFVKALYSGGTLAYECLYNLEKNTKLNIFSNLSKNKILNKNDMKNNIVIDFGDDEYTKGKAHPMIDPSYRNKIFEEILSDGETSIVILDIVLGYGSHKEPHKQIIEIYKKVKKYVEKLPLVFIDLLGTNKDIQGYEKIKRELLEEGFYVFECNKDMIDSVVELLK